jgi:hypothetical protein
MYRAAGDLDRGSVELLTVARAVDVPADLRSDAYQRVLSIANNRLDYGAMVELSVEWLDQAPNSGNAAWTRILALVRLGRATDALAVYDEKKPPVIDLARARLASELFIRAAPAERAVREIAALSEQFNRSDERLELYVLRASWGAQLTAELGERVRDDYEGFKERFPESQALVAVPAPTNREEYEALIKQLGGEEQAEARRELESQIQNGSTGVFTLAMVAPVGVASIWAHLECLPLSFADRALTDAELADARQAIGGPAVWDSSVISVLDLLGDDHASMVRNALPGSMLAHAILADLDQDSLTSGTNAQVGRTGVNPGRAVKGRAPVGRGRGNVRLGGDHWAV